MLGGLLFVRVEGYMEADRDVIRLDPDVATMQAQQGYVCCMPQSVPYRRGQGETYVAPLHCCVRVLPSQVKAHALLLLLKLLMFCKQDFAPELDTRLIGIHNCMCSWFCMRLAIDKVFELQVNSEFQAFKHIESLGRGELMRASRPLEVTVAVYPTLVLTNALPYDMDIVVWQVTFPPLLRITEASRLF